MSLATLLFWLGIMFLFLVLNALFVAAEYALVRLRRSRVDELVDKGKAGAKTVQTLQRNLGTTIAGTQLGITLCSLALGWLGEKSINEAFKMLFEKIPGLTGAEPPAWLGFMAPFVVLSMLHVIIGEQVPKSFALRLSEKTAFWLSPPLRIFCFFMKPFLWVMHSLASLVLRLMGLPPKKGDEVPVHSADELQILIEASHEAGNLGSSETGLLTRALELKELIAKQIMVPRTRMDCVLDNMTLSELLGVVSRTKHSKLPVLKQGTNQVVGILNTKDLFDWWQGSLKTGGNGITNGGKDFKLPAFLRQAYFVTDTAPATKLLEEMKARKLQMAIVLDPAGATCGLITLEDLLEQLVGEIWDEYDTPIIGIDKKAEDRWHVSGELTLFEFKKVLGTSLSSDSSSTVSGAVAEALGREPVVGDSVEIDGLRFTALEVKDRKATRLDVLRLPPPPPEEPAA
jgi:putative hemolysin